MTSGPDLHHHCWAGTFWPIEGERRGMEERKDRCATRGPLCPGHNTCQSSHLRAEILPWPGKPERKKIFAALPTRSDAGERRFGLLVSGLDQTGGTVGKQSGGNMESLRGHYSLGPGRPRTRRESFYRLFPDTG